MTLRPAILALATALLAAACAGSAEPTATAPPPTSPSEAGDAALGVAVASFDLAVGDDARFLAGLFVPDAGLVVGDEVEMTFAFLGEQDASGPPEELATTTATFLPVPGKEPERSFGQPAVIDAADATGVYETRVDLARPGLYEVMVTADVETVGEVSGTAAFTVAADPQVVIVGEAAPAVTNDTIDSGAPPEAIDSRAVTTDGEIPDPELHDTTVAAALEAGRPIVVVVSTPVYCVSRFCGPITETVEALAARYDDRAEFVHIEVWKDFSSNVLNDAAAAWIQTPEGGNEPWVFLVGADGRIAARWDNVLDAAALESMLSELPAA